MRSDTEVVLAAYTLGAVLKNLGMFAFALWDSGKRTLLARDRRRQPLYYAEARTPCISPRKWRC